MAVCMFELTHLILAGLLGVGGGFGAKAPSPQQAPSVVGSAGRQAPEPLPDASAFAAKVRATLRTDRALRAQYTFLERREEISISKLGKVKEGPVKVYEVYPSEEPGNTWKRLISVNGQRLSASELER